MGRYLRKMNTSSSSRYQPDMSFYYPNSNVCMFRGEEEASGILQVPVNRLHAKLRWKYDAAPYIYGYAAAGLLVCLVVIQKNEKTERGAKAKIIDKYDLGELGGRLRFFLAILNLSTLFHPAVKLIAFAEECVVKMYSEDMPSDKIIRNLRDLHHQMTRHSVPNVVMLKRTNMIKRYVELAPVGQPAPPENAQQLRLARYTRGARGTA
ncbi:hypothetical protein Plhal304r1_c022g0076701 [Plasmopara halstedii]